MRIRVEATWNGTGHGYRMIDRHGNREYAKGEIWDRAMAIGALDLFEHVYGYDRSSIRFEHS